MLLDLGSLKSVRSFAENFLKSEPRLDILINNAGEGVRTRWQNPSRGTLFIYIYIGFLRYKIITKIK